ncbi:MAG: cyclase family protein [Deltaproteobacteria bacterium]|nr:cyclase family protein [Deltaproteobacteria bacterium]
MMAGALIRYDLSLPNYFSYPPAPGVDTRALIPRGAPRSLYIRGEYGRKPGGEMRPIPAHNTTHLDVPFHFDAAGADLSQVVNNPLWAGDRPSLARVVALGGNPALPGSHTRQGVTYCEAVGAEVLPPLEDLRRYESLVILTGFGALMAGLEGFQFTHGPDGFYHVPWLKADAVARILEAGLRLVAMDSTTIEQQISSEPHRMSGEAHHALLGNSPPVLVVECLNGANLESQVGFIPAEALLHMVPRRVNAQGAEAAHSRAFLYFYRDDTRGEALRRLQSLITPQEYHG